MTDIKPFERAHKDVIVQMLKRRGTFPEHEIKVAIEVLDDALQFPDRTDYQVYCAFEGAGELAGYVCFGQIPMTDGCYDLYWIAVDEQHARKKIGTTLLRYMEERIHGQGARRIYIETSSLPAFAAARSFYKKHHYEVVSILTDFYKAGDHKMVFMKDLKPIAA